MVSSTTSHEAAARPAGKDAPNVGISPDAPHASTPTKRQWVENASGSAQPEPSFWMGSVSLQSGVSTKVSVSRNARPSSTLSAENVSRACPLVGSARDRQPTASTAPKASPLTQHPIPNAREATHANSANTWMQIECAGQSAWPIAITIRRPAW